MPTVKSPISLPGGINSEFALSALLKPHQRRAICKLAKARPEKGIAWWRMGRGKTRLALSLYLHRLAASKNSKSICLIVTRPKAYYEWHSELKYKLGCDYPIRVGFDNLWFPVRPCFWLVSFASLGKLGDCAEGDLRRVDTVLVDELYLFSNPRADRTKQLNRFTEGRSAYGFSGTIMPNKDNTAIFGQCFALNLHCKLASCLTSFRDRFQTRFKVNVKTHTFLQFQNAPHSVPRIYNRLRNHIDIDFTKSKIKVVEDSTLVAITNSQRRHLRNLKELLILDDQDLGIDREFKYTVQWRNVARGILNGWIEDRNGTCKEIESPKREALLCAVSKLVDVGQKVVVWCAFKNDVEMLARHLPVASLQMVGGKDFDMHSWERGKVQVVLATVGSGASVNHFRNVEYCYYFSLSDRPLDYEQSAGRHDRLDSLHTTVYHRHFQVINSIDTLVYRHCKGAIKTQQDFIDQSRKWLISL